jgi:hypothetical protein
MNLKNNNLFNVTNVTEDFTYTLYTYVNAIN